MDREEALKENYNNFDCMYPQMLDSKLLINQIYDDMESRTCKNCKYYSYFKQDGCAVCDHEENIQEYLGGYGMQITEDFGCTNWKSK